MEVGVKEKISAEKDIEVLQRDGVNVSVHEAAIILDFLYQIGKIIVEQYLKK